MKFKVSGKHLETKQRIIIAVVSVVLLSIILIYYYLHANLTYIQQVELITIFIYFADAMLMFIIFPLILEESKREKIERVFPEYLRDLVKALRTGYPLSLALDYVIKTNDYGAFQPYAKELAVKISWGRKFEDELLEIAKRIKSKILLLSAEIISSASKAGGKIVEIANAVSDLISTLWELELRRRAMLKSNTYIVLVVFGAYLAAMYIITYTFIPSFVQAYADRYILLMYLAVVGQAIWSGVLAGQIEKLSVVASLKWVAILLLITATAYGLVIVLKPPVTLKQILKAKQQLLEMLNQTATYNQTRFGLM
jgi:hypothetical protein